MFTHSRVPGGSVIEIGEVVDSTKNGKHCAELSQSLPPEQAQAIEQLCHDITGNPSIRKTNEIRLSGHYDRSQPHREGYRTNLAETTSSENYARPQLHREILMCNVVMPD